MPFTLISLLCTSCSFCVVFMSLWFVLITYYIAYYHSIRQHPRSQITFSRCNLLAVSWHRPIRQHEATVSHQLFRTHLLSQNAEFPVIITSDARYQTMGLRGTEEEDRSLSTRRARSDEEDQESAGADHGENTQFRMVKITKIYCSRQGSGMYDDQSQTITDDW